TYRVTTDSPRVSGGALGGATVTAGQVSMVIPAFPVVSPSAPPSASPPPSPSSSPAPATCPSSDGPGIAPPAKVASGMGGFHASWFGQSGYPTLCPGQTSPAVVAFSNSCTRDWVARTMADVAYLGTWEHEPGRAWSSTL